jgi:hypothetical protein
VDYEAKKIRNFPGPCSRARSSSRDLSRTPVRRPLFADDRSEYEINEAAVLRCIPLWRIFSASSIRPDSAKNAMLIAQVRVLATLAAEAG